MVLSGCQIIVLVCWAMVGITKFVRMHVLVKSSTYYKIIEMVFRVQNSVLFIRV